MKKQFLFTTAGLLIYWFTGLLSVHATNPLPFITRLDIAENFDRLELTLSKRNTQALVTLEYFGPHLDLIEQRTDYAGDQRIEFTNTKYAIDRALNYGDLLHIRAVVCNTDEKGQKTEACGPYHTIQIVFDRYATQYNKARLRVAPGIFIQNLKISDNQDQITVRGSQGGGDLWVMYHIKKRGEYEILAQDHQALDRNPITFDDFQATLMPLGKSGDQFDVTFAICPARQQKIDLGCSLLEKITLLHPNTPRVNDALKPSPIPEYQPLFPDVQPLSLLDEATTFLYEREILGGYPDGTFKPERAVNRAEAAKILLTARFGMIRDRFNNNRFSDVKNRDWFVRYIVTASELGIINGHPDGTFRPGETVNTAEFLKMMALTFKLPTAKGPHIAWYLPYLPLGEQYDLFPNFRRTPSPSYLMTRRDVAIAMYQYLSKTVDQ